MIDRGVHHLKQGFQNQPYLTVVVAADKRGSFPALWGAAVKEKRFVQRVDVTGQEDGEAIAVVVVDEVAEDNEPLGESLESC